MPSTLDNYHGTIVEIADALLGTFARLGDADFEGFSWEKLRTQRRSHFIQIDHGHVMHLHTLETAHPTK